MLEEVPNGWKLTEDNKKEGITIHATSSPRGNNSFKASGEVDFPLDVCLAVMTDAKYRTSYDVNVDCSEII